MCVEAIQHGFCMVEQLIGHSHWRDDLSSSQYKTH